jgi:hypothetical protein
MVSPPLATQPDVSELARALVGEMRASRSGDGGQVN